MGRRYCRLRTCGRRNRHHALMSVLREYDVHWWCDAFLDTLVKARAEESAKRENERHA